MKYIGYVAIPIDFFLGNVHFAYAAYPACSEWYTSDVGEFTRITMWMIVALFWVRSSVFENVSVGIHVFFALLDLLFVISGTLYGLNPTALIISELFALFLVQLFSLYTRLRG